MNCRPSGARAGPSTVAIYSLAHVGARSNTVIATAPTGALGLGSAPCNVIAGGALA